MPLDLHGEGETLAPAEASEFWEALGVVVAKDVVGSLRDNLVTLAACVRWEAPTALGRQARLVVLGTRANIMTRFIKGPLPDDAKLARFATASPVSPAPGRGRPSQQAVRESLRSIVRIVEMTATTPAPKIVALLIWLCNCSIIDERDGETPAGYIARLTREIEKRSRIRTRP